MPVNSDQEILFRGYVSVRPSRFPAVLFPVFCSCRLLCFWPWQNKPTCTLRSYCIFLALSFTPPTHQGLLTSRTLGARRRIKEATEMRGQEFLKWVPYYRVSPSLPLLFCQCTLPLSLPPLRLLVPGSIVRGSQWG